MKQQRVRINSFIKARELRIIDDTGNNLGVISLEEAIKMTEEKGLDLIEISPNAVPPIAKIMDYGKFQYEQKKKAKAAKAKTKIVETKVVQVKVGTGEHDLNLKASNVSKWLKEGHRVKIDLFLVGRAKYSDDAFKRERLERILKLITEDYKVADEAKRSPKGFTVVIEKAKGKTKQENEN
ncbi:MAG: translation initiation factor IF-3 [Candidatus Pacebacteria bacterium]|nr:translation initiation factor IF-3 [Candidatus Paceibacterota bacterium]